VTVDTGPPSGTRRQILVVANETMLGDVLHAAVRSAAAADGTADVLVVAPALNSRLRHWISDVDGARRSAERRLEHCLERLAAPGIEARGSATLNRSGTSSSISSSAGSTSPSTRCKDPLSLCLGRARIGIALLRGSFSR
jgi:hypothetical protein